MKAEELTLPVRMAGVISPYTRLIGILSFRTLESTTLTVCF